MLILGGQQLYFFKFGYFCISNSAILFSMVDLVVQIIFRFAKFSKYNRVNALLNFKPAQRPLGGPDRLEKDRTFC